MPEDVQRHVITPTVRFDIKLETLKKKRDMDANEVKVTKRQTTVAGHYVQPRTAKAVGNPNNGSLPKAGEKVPFGAILDQLEHCDTSIVPNCLRALYDFPPDFPANPKNSYGIVECTPQAYLPSDLDMFFRKFSLSQVGDRPIFDSIDGGFLQTNMESSNYNGESDLDLEYAMSLVYPQKVTLYQAVTSSKVHLLTTSLMRSMEATAHMKVVMIQIKMPSTQILTDLALVCIRDLRTVEASLQPK